MPRFVWNGVGLTAPDNWEPAAIERDGLFLESDGVPVCELKWNSVQGSFSFEKHLKRLTKSHKQADLRGVPESETPEVWQASLASLAESGIRHQSFIWQTEVHRGIGAALHNPATGLAALVQFFIHRKDDEAVAAEVLASFRDHSAGKTIPWAMFGLTGRIPTGFQLHTFTFQPGHYTIKYWLPKSVRQAKLPPGKGAGTTLIFERFAPASVLLNGTDLEAWLRANLKDGPSEEMPFASSPGLVSWEGVSKGSLLRRALRREVHSSGRAWVTDTGNSILSVRASGVIPVDERQLIDICEAYELV
ncbi:hypothetical protein [Pseudodesulfovibrio sp. zrk46]|uniref:hypothetical protein n=1 Tax=Pseudodesulfovibrio sp. zrk46 TaxID=2725288 RepID=UPI0014490126|nr:hypothetical protein [Pseudodesulfovibrio sp. zrk46]QJB56403.1 hypothetical protein HFN16_08240 [Pseudodesulfovibrio sp. zrk46]